MTLNKIYLYLIILLSVNLFVCAISITKTKVSPFIQQSDSILPTKNLVVNGDFESGNVNFKSEYDYITDTIFHGRYTVTNNIHNLNYRLTSPPTGDHTSGKGNYLVIDSKIFRSSIKSKVWISNPIKVNKNTNYIFSAWVFHVGGGGSSSPELTITVDDKVIGKAFRIPHNSLKWEHIYYKWNSGHQKGKIVLSIENNYYYQYIEDFAIDDILFGQE